MASETERTPVEELEGRELDAAVAREVFGAEVAWREFAGRKHPYADRTLWTKWCPTCGYDGHWDARYVPKFSTDIAAAWEVVEALASDGFYIHLSDNRHGCYRLDGESVSGFWAGVSSHEQGDDYPRQHVRGLQADTAPLAIARAALKAVRHTDAPPTSL